MLIRILTGKPTGDECCCVGRRGGGKATSSSENQDDVCSLGRAIVEGKRFPAGLMLGKTCLWMQVESRRNPGLDWKNEQA